MVNPILILQLALSALLVVTASDASAQLYKWTDEKGVVNYSNALPPKSKARDVALVENRLSTYTPDKDVIEAMQSARELRRSGSARAGGSSDADIERGARSHVAVLGPAPATRYDPCAGGSDVNCQAAFPYEGSPVFAGRQRVPLLFQPQLPPGAIAGHVVGADGFIPGLSAQAQALAPARAMRTPRASFTLKGTRPGPAHHSRR